MPSGAAGLLPSGAAPSRTRRIKKPESAAAAVSFRGSALLGTARLGSAPRRRCPHFSGRAVHTRAKSRLSQRHPRGSWQCVTAEAHPLPFKHQDNTLFRRLLPCLRPPSRAALLLPPRGRLAASRRQRAKKNKANKASFRVPRASRVSPAYLAHGCRFCL